jgi:hypothetical protein
MWDSIKRLLGIPTQSGAEQKEAEVVKTPEFDLTKYAKGLVPISAAVLAGVIAALEEAGVKEVTEPAVLAAVLAVVAAAVLAVSFIAAVDIAARAFLSGEGSASEEGEEDGKDDESPGEAGPTHLIPAPSGMQVMLRDDSQPRPVLGVSGDGKKVSSYLVSVGSPVTWEVGDRKVKAVNAAPKWYSADEVEGIRTSAWP